MNIKYIYNRFHQMKDAYIGETSIIRTCWLWLGWINNAILYGASISDYFAYGFYKLNYTGKQDYITYRRFHKILRKANNQKDIEICRNKAFFNQKFSDLIGRDWLDISNSNLRQFVDFISQHDTFFIKDIYGYCGIGTQKIQCKNINKQQLWEYLSSDKRTKYIVEEKISQHAELEEFHPWSINTLRIVTLFDTNNNKVHIMKACLRIGNKKNSVDNFHHDGLCANIDIKSGVIDTVAYDKTNYSYIYHPITGKQIIGFRIPKWEACKTYVEGAARRLPTIRYIGWDIVVRKDGTFCIIEANDNADHDVQQFHYKGLWQEYKQLLKHF